MIINSMNLRNTLSNMVSWRFSLKGPNPTPKVISRLPINVVNTLLKARSNNSVILSLRRIIKF